MAGRGPGDTGLSEGLLDSGRGSTSSPAEEAMSGGGSTVCEDEGDDAAGSSTAYSGVNKSCGREGKSEN